MSKELAIEAIGRVMSQLPQNGLATARDAALAHLREHGLPTLRDEDWKYTDLSRIVEISNAWLTANDAEATPPAPAVDPAAVTGIDDVQWIVIANGIIDAGTVADAEATGIEVSLLSESGLELDFERPLADLNAALLVDGLRIRVGGDAHPGGPIGLLFMDSVSNSASVAQARIDIRVDTDAALDLVEYHCSSGAAGHYSNILIGIELADGARVNHVRIQDRHRDHAQTTRTRAGLGRDSLFRHWACDLGGALVRNDLEIDIAQPGAAAEFSGIYLAGAGQHVDNHTRVDHRTGPARSEQEYRGIAAAKGRCVWNGKAIVHAGADGTDARQANHNLLLDDGAEIDAKPELEIYADDVKCSHGTTVGELDSNALYYLRTRGLARKEAEKLLTVAFVQALVAATPVPVLSGRLETLVGERLGALLTETDE